MRCVGGRFFLAALTVLTASSAQAGPLAPGQPAGVREAQLSRSFMVFSGVAAVAAGAGYLFSTSLGGSTDSTILAINGGQANPNPSGSVSTSTTTP